MTEDQPTDEHRVPDPPEESTEIGRPVPSMPPTYPPAPAPQPPPPPQQAPPPQPQPPAYAPPAPAYQPPAPPQPYPAPPPQPTVQGGGGTLWLRPESGVQPVQSPAPPASYIGAPVAQPYPAYPLAPTGPVEPDNGKAVASMVLGIVGLFFLVSGLGIIAPVNLTCSILAWIFGVQGKRKVDQGITTKGDGMAKAGFWTGLVGTILGVLAIVIWIVAIAASA